MFIPIHKMHSWALIKVRCALQITCHRKIVIVTKLKLQTTVKSIIGITAFKNNKIVLKKNKIVIP